MTPGERIEALKRAARSAMLAVEEYDSDAAHEILWRALRDDERQTESEAA